MTSPLKLLGIALISIVLFSGLGAAAGIGVGMAQAGSGQAAATADRPMDGSNSPWLVNDDRLDRFQTRFGLTDVQMDEIQTSVVEALDEGAGRTEIRSIVSEKLESFGVDDPDLGPTDDLGRGDGHNGPNGDGAGRQGPHGGQGNGSGPYGPGDGSCVTG